MGDDVHCFPSYGFIEGNTALYFKNQKIIYTLWYNNFTSENVNQRSLKWKKCMKIFIKHYFNKKAIIWINTHLGKWLMLYFLDRYYTVNKIMLNKVMLGKLFS